MIKLALAAQGGPGYDPRTAHLRPVIEYLLAQGNTPAGWRGDAFAFDQRGEGRYLFTDPIDAVQLREHFAFPDSIRLDDDGTIRDGLNRVDISYDQPSPPLSFELAPAHAPFAESAPPSTASPAVDNGEADEILRQIIAARHK